MTNLSTLCSRFISSIYGKIALVLLFFSLLFVVVWRLPSVQLALAGKNTLTQLEHEWDALSSHLPLLGFTEDFQTNQYFFEVDLPIDSLVGTVHSNFKVYSDYGQKQLLCSLILGGHSCFLYISDYAITLETTALRNSYGAYVATFAEDWNNAFFTTTTLPEDFALQLFEYTPTLSPSFVEMLTSHLNTLIHSLSFSSLPKEDVVLDGATHSLPTYGISMEEADFSQMLDNILKDIRSKPDLLEELFLFLRFYAVDSSTLSSIKQSNDVAFQTYLDEKASEYKERYSHYQDGTFSVCLYQKHIVQLNYKGEVTQFLRFDQPSNFLSSITLSHDAEETRLQAKGSENYVFFSLRDKENSLYELEWYPQQLGNNGTLTFADEVHSFSFMENEEEYYLTFPLKSNNIATIYVQKRVFPLNWFEQSDDFQEFFQMTQLQMLLLLGELSIS